jgi:hypothetical protein
MAILVRHADVANESASLLAFLSRHLSSEVTKSRYDWLYLDNPDGRALAWVAVESDHQRTIGMAAAFPRKFSSNGEILPGFILGDFCIHPEYRSLGPAATLQRKCLGELAQTDAVFVMDFPSVSMLSIYRRLGTHSLFEMPRYAKPLRSNDFIRQRITNTVISNWISAIGNLALKIRDLRLPHVPGLAISDGVKACGPEFTEALVRWQSQELSPVRTREFLNWRFMEHPSREYQLATARENGRLVGYVIWQSEANNSTVVDFQGDNSEVCVTLLSHTIAKLRSAGVNTLSAPLLGTGYQKTALERCAFRPREESPVILLKRNELKAGFENANLNPLHLTHGDRES